MISPVNDLETMGSFRKIRRKNILEGESSQEGVRALQRSTSTDSAKSNWSKLLGEVLNPNGRRVIKNFVPRWEIIFIVSSAFSIFVDPLICYIPVTDERRTCYVWDQNLMWTFFVLRTAGDLFYAMDIVVFLRQSSRNGKKIAKSIEASWMKIIGRHKGISKLFKGERSLKSLRNLARVCAFLRILPRIWVALPILQAVILTGKYVSENDQSFNRLFYLIPIQYALRGYNLYRWLDQHSNIETAIRRVLKALLDFLPFVLASHLFGALWYRFAGDSELFCWQEYVCEHANVCGAILQAYFYCSDFTEDNYAADMINMTSLKEACAVQVSKDVPTLPFDFGIYQYALQSDLTRSSDLPMKILQCFWWGLRNLSSFGSNLQTAFFIDEIILSIVICISGLALFLVYLNSRIQGSRKILDQHKLRQKMGTIYTEMIEQVRNMYHLRLALLKKVSMLEGLDEKVLKAICEHLKPVTYGDDFYIIREGELVRKMIFITQGTALMYTNSNGGTYSCACLERNDFYGDGLLNWVFQCDSFSELPVSTKTVLCQTKVEAFAITANSLQSVVAEYWWHFERDLAPSRLEHLAASSFGPAFRGWCAKARASIRERAQLVAGLGQPRN